MIDLDLGGCARQDYVKVGISSIIYCILLIVNIDCVLLQRLQFFNFPTPWKNVEFHAQVPWESGYIGWLNFEQFCPCKMISLFQNFVTNYFTKM